MSSTRRSAALVALGTATTSTSKWFLVWLFAQTAGGPRAGGEYSFILAVATPIFVACQLGLRTIFLSETTRWPWGTYVRLRIIGTAVGAALLVTAVAVLPQIPLTLGLAIAALKVVDSILDLQLGRIQYANRMMRLGGIVTVSGVATMAAAAATVLLTGSAPTAVLSAAAVSAAAAFTARIVARSTKYVPNGDNNDVKRILSASVPITTAQLMSTALFQLPILALTWVAGAHTVGVFTGAAYMLTAASLAGSTLQTLLITPFRVRRDRAGPSAVRVFSVKMTRWTTLSGLPFGIAAVAVGAPVLAVIYGPAFVMGRLPLALLAVAAIATMTAFVLSVTLTVLNRYASVTWGMGLSCIASAVAGSLLFLASVEPLVVGAGMSAAAALVRVVLMYWFVTRAVPKTSAS